MNYRYFLIAFILNASPILSDDIQVTQTIYGFLDFTTTIGNTVMVFSPQSAPAVVPEKIDIPTNIIETKPFVETPPEDDGIKPTKATNTETSTPVEPITEKSTTEKSTTEKPTTQKPTTPEPTTEKPTTQKPTTEKPATTEKPKTEKPVTEKPVTEKPVTEKAVTEKPVTEKSVPVKPVTDEQTTNNKPITKKSSKKNQKVNIVEAQKNKNNNNDSNTPKTISSSSVVIAAPAPLDDDDEQPPTLQIENNVFEYDLLSRQPTEYAEETYRVINNKPSDKPRNRHNQRRTHETSPEPTVAHESTASAHRSKPNQASNNKPHSSGGPKAKKPKIRSTTPLRVLKTTSPTPSKPQPPQEHKNNRLNGANRQSSKGYRANEKEQEHVAVTEAVVESSQVTQSHKKSRSKPKRKSKHNRSSAAHKSSTAIVLASSAEAPRKSFRTKVRPSNVEDQASTSIYMFKLNRTPGRWQYTTTPKPRVAIRKPTEGNTTKTVDPFASNPNLNVISENVDLESSGSQNGAVVNNIDQGGNYQHLVETLNVEISTPADFKDTYYELATIKTPYAFQVGGLKKTRFITVTSTIEKTLTPDPTEVLTPDGPLTENILASSTRMPNLLHDSSVTTLRAIHIGEHEETPSLDTVIDSFSTTLKKLRTQVLPIIYDVNNETSYVTLTQTYDITSLITLTKTMSPLETDIPLSSFTDFGANLDEAGSEINLELEFGDEDNAENTKDDKQQSYRPKLSDIADLFGKASGNLTAEEIQRLALWKLQSSSSSQQQQQQQQQFSSIMLPSIPQFTPESTLPFPSLAPSINPFLLPLQQFQTITSSIVHETLATQMNSKVLKLTFGARTAYTTIFSSEVVPTRATSYITTSIPVQPTPPGFPGYFPQPYPQYYLG